MAFAAFADAPVDVAVVEVGMGGTWDATNVVDGAVAVVTPIGLDHTDYLGDTIGEIAGEKAGIIKPDAIAVARPSSSRGGRGAAAAGRRGRRDRGPGGHRVRRASPATVAVGGQVLTLQGLGGVYDEIFLPLHGAHQAQNAAVALAAVEAFLGAGADTGSARRRGGPRGASSAVSSPGRLEVVRSAPTVLRRRRAQPARDGGDASPRWASRSRSAGWSAWSRCSADKDAAGDAGALEPVLDEIVVTAELARPARCRPTSSPRWPCEVFGADRVVVEPRLDDAIEAAMQLAEEGEDQLGGAGVLVTGSVVTVGEARTLLGAGRRPDEPAADVPDPDAGRRTAAPAPRRWPARRRHVRRPAVDRRRDAGAAGRRRRGRRRAGGRGDAGGDTGGGTVPPRRAVRAGRPGSGRPGWGLRRRRRLSGRRRGGGSGRSAGRSRRG